MRSRDLCRCRVCGLELSEGPWGNGGRSPSYDYCPCCGVEFGYADASVLGAQRFREAWLREGAIWSEPDERPCRWVLDEQLSGVPEKFR